MATQRAVGAWAWLIASLPQGNATEGLNTDPPAADRHRPPGQAQHQPLPDREQAEDYRLGDRKRGPRIPGHVDQPGQQRNEERQAECEPDQEGAAQAPAPERNHEQRRRNHSERPDPGGRERCLERQPSNDRDHERQQDGHTPSAPGGGLCRSGRGLC
jgi:hypothetical protein